ncbi:hypothetical protein [Winogradskya humida]|uniref:Single-stranded DNA-binding protein n=1 Tax=Winogradskya humida TaxID=113566 RepID=A0ABQ4A740_9ACTN|nr:hypothetical protein [Actinoplanes humidus]GIE26675.1 hypothetical protein Ahu01nite_097770 [Actinoplanes humidus]
MTYPDQWGQQPQQQGGWGQQPPAQQQGGWGQSAQPQSWGGQPQGWAPPAQQAAPPAAPAPQRPAPPPPSPDELMSGGYKGAKFPDGQYGTVVGGLIIEAPSTVQQRDFESGQLRFYDDGNPMWQIVVPVQAQPAGDEDDGIRAFYLKTQMKKAVQDAVRSTGAQRLEVGGVLHVRYVRDEPNGRGRGKDKKIYEARYQPPAPGVPAAPAGPPPSAAPAAPMSAVTANLPSGQQLPPGQFTDEPPF